MNPTITPPAPPDTAHTRAFFTAHSLTKRLGWPTVDVHVIGNTLSYLVTGESMADKQANLFHLASLIDATVEWTEYTPDVRTAGFVGKLEVSGQWRGVDVVGYMCLTGAEAGALGYMDCPHCVHLSHMDGPCTVGVIDRDGLGACCNCPGLGDVPRDVEPPVLDAVALAVQALADDERHGAVWDAERDAAREARADAYFQRTGSAGDVDGEDAS